ncbi:MAG TPA: class I SAM-dependent methyltransferase [Solirubrobacterales bacterium]|jgi:SAM-dependent methyltransferase|nr:class I SAM-dependent methyltransferase [Solirubrobacterales bacterium]
MNTSAAAIWHDVECGSYGADLPLWEELAERCGGPVLELGCGTGRVALHLARRGHEVVGLDRDPELLAVLAERGADLSVQALEADARNFELGSPASLVLAPTHLLQLLADSSERAESLRCIATALRPGGILAAAIIEEMPEPDGAPPPLPDVREVDGWVYSSLATEAAVGPGEIVVRRLRQTVSPQGSLREEPNEVRIATFAAEVLEAEAEPFSLLPAGRHEIAATDIHVGSLVVLLEKAA